MKNFASFFSFQPMRRLAFHAGRKRRAFRQTKDADLAVPSLSFFATVSLFLNPFSSNSQFLRFFDQKSSRLAWKNPLRLFLVVLLILGGSLILFHAGSVWAQEEDEADSLEVETIDEDSFQYDPLEEILEAPVLETGILAYMNGDLSECYKIFQQAHEDDSQLPPPGILMARLFSDDNQYLLMRQYLEKTIDDFPNDPEAFFQLAGIALQEKRFTEASLLIEKGISVFEAFKAELAKTSATGPVAKEPSDTDTDLDEKETSVLEDRTKFLTVELLSLQANFAQAKEQYDRAEEFVREIIAQDPENDWAYASLGYLLFEQDKADQADEMFEAARKIDANHLPGWLMLALLFDQANKREDAQRWAEKQSMKDATVGQIYSLVNLYLKWNQLDKAEALAKDLETHYPNCVERWNLYGLIALYHFQYQKAEEFYRKALLINPVDFVANNGIALAMGDQGTKNKIKQAVNVAYNNWQRYKNSDEAISTYAWSLYLYGQKEEAETIFSPILRQGKMTPTVAYYLAEIAYAKDDSPLALNFIELALSQADNFPKRQAVLELQKLIQDETADDTDDNQENENNDPEDHGDNIGETLDTNSLEENANKDLDTKSSDSPAPEK